MPQNYGNPKDVSQTCTRRDSAADTAPHERRSSLTYPWRAGAVRGAGHPGHCLLQRPAHHTAHAPPGEHGGCGPGLRVATAARPRVPDRLPGGSRVPALLTPPSVERPACACQGWRGVRPLFPASLPRPRPCRVTTCAWRASSRCAASRFQKAGVRRGAPRRMCPVIQHYCPQAYRQAIQQSAEPCGSGRSRMRAPVTRQMWSWCMGCTPFAPGKPGPHVLATGAASRHGPWHP